MAFELCDSGFALVDRKALWRFVSDVTARPRPEGSSSVRSGRTYTRVKMDGTGFSHEEVVVVPLCALQEWSDGESLSGSRRRLLIDMWEPTVRR